MIFSVTTRNHLCGSKVFLESKKEIFKHLDKVIKSTEEFRKKWTPEQLWLCGWKNKITKKEIEDSISVLKIEDVEGSYIKETFLNAVVPINWQYLQLSIKNAIRNEEERIRKANKQEESNLLEQNDGNNKRNIYRRIHRTGSQSTDSTDISSQEEAKI